MARLASRTVSDKLGSSVGREDRVDKDPRVVGTDWGNNLSAQRRMTMETAVE